MPVKAQALWTIIMGFWSIEVQSSFTYCYPLSLDTITPKLPEDFQIISLSILWANFFSRKHRETSFPFVIYEKASVNFFFINTTQFLIPHYRSLPSGQEKREEI